MDIEYPTVSITSAAQKGKEEDNFLGYTFGFEIELRAFQFDVPKYLESLPKKNQYIFRESKYDFSEQSTLTGSLLCDAGTVEFVSRPMPYAERQKHFQTLKEYMNGLCALQKLLLKNLSFEQSKGWQGEITVEQISECLLQHNISSSPGLLSKQYMLTYQYVAGYIRRSANREILGYMKEGQRRLLLGGVRIHALG